MTHIEQLSHHLKLRGLRLTAERRKLVQLVLGMAGHFGIEEVLGSVRKKRLGVSRATVYRVLPVLVEAGLIQTSLLSDATTRYEVVWDRPHHDHLICTQCNTVVEFRDSTIEKLQNEIANKHGFTLEHHVMELVGKCRNCR